MHSTLERTNTRAHEDESESESESANLSLYKAKSALIEAVLQKLHSAALIRSKSTHITNHIADKAVGLGGALRE